MTIAIKQPYLFPYIGYFQVINYVDRYIIFDDVNYINRGWINRNNILVDGKPFMFTLPLKGASQNRLINELELSDNSKWNSKFLKTLETSYRRAPYYEAAMTLIESVLFFGDNNLSVYVTNSIKRICDHLGISTPFIVSTGTFKTESFKGQGKILEICKSINAETYVDTQGAMKLYDREIFRIKGLDLKFLLSNNKPYRQSGDQFVPYLSIIDVLMFNSRENVRVMLDDFKLA